MVDSSIQHGTDNFSECGIRRADVATTTVYSNPSDAINPFLDILFSIEERKSSCDLGERLLAMQKIPNVPN
jgi:hypothetical protein